MARDQVEKQYNNSTVDSSTQTEEQIKKLRERLNKAENDVVTTRNDYKEAIRDITNYNPKYKDDMVFMFDKLQASEEKRKMFMKNTMQSICHVLHPRQFFERFSQIYDNLSQTIEKCEPASDISWWAAEFGAETPVHWVEFEEYNPNSTDGVPSTQETQISKKADKKIVSTDGSKSPKTEKSTVCTTL